MGNEANWDTFAKTGRVSDYLAYAKREKGSENSTGWENRKEEERGPREGTGNGDSAFGSYHW